MKKGFTLLLLPSGVKEAVDGGVIDDGYDGETFVGVMLGEERLGGKVVVEDGVVDRGNKSSINHGTRTVLTDSGVVRDRVGGEIY